MLDSAPRTLPNRRPDRMWGGASSGLKCAICYMLVTRDQVELEIEFAQDGGLDIYHVHVPCFVAWERQLDEPRVGDDVGRQPVAVDALAVDAIGDGTESRPVLTQVVNDGKIIDSGRCRNLSEQGPA